jgi:hypothetical protein
MIYTHPFVTILKQCWLIFDKLSPCKTIIMLQLKLLTNLDVSSMRFVLEQILNAITWIIKINYNNISRIIMKQNDMNVFVGVNIMKNHNLES